MSTFLERLQEEEKGLIDNLTKLNTYIETSDHFKTLTLANQILLIDQRVAMETYAGILAIRIELNSK